MYLARPPHLWYNAHCTRNIVVILVEFETIVVFTLHTSSLLEKITIKVESWIVHYFHNRMCRQLLYLPRLPHLWYNTHCINIVLYLCINKYCYPPTTILFCKLFSQIFLLQWSNIFFFVIGPAAPRRGDPYSHHSRNVLTRH